MIEIRVRGVPKPGGSKNAFPLKRGGRYVTGEGGRPIIRLVDASDNAAWKKAVRDAATLAMRGFDPFDCPVKAFVRFYIARPQSHYNSRGDLKPNAPRFPLKNPDATKLWRSTEDAMNGVAWKDDNRVVRQDIGKDWADKDTDIGAVIVLYPLSNEREKPGATT
jgi:Holliday junction resolvase RusA-like endonuclease